MSDDQNNLICFRTTDEKTVVFSRVTPFVMCNLNGEILVVVGGLKFTVGKNESDRIIDMFNGTYEYKEEHDTDLS